MVFKSLEIIIDNPYIWKKKSFFFKSIDNFLYTVGLHQLSSMKMPLNKKFGMIPIGNIGTWRKDMKKVSDSKWNHTGRKG